MKTIEKKDGPADSPQTPIECSTTYVDEGNFLYRLVTRGEKIVKTLVANFLIRIIARIIIVNAEGVTEKTGFEIEVIREKAKAIILEVSAEDYVKDALYKNIITKAGKSAILYGTVKDLRVSAQLLANKNIPVKMVTESIGWTPYGSYVSNGYAAIKAGDKLAETVSLDLKACSHAKKLGFKKPGTNKQMAELGTHILQKYLGLKSHSVTYPLIGHIVLALFSSCITKLGLQKPVMHLQGASGGGKTFLGILASCFYGDFSDPVLQWTSTANAIESVGYYFRDSLLLVDDYKSSSVETKGAIRILQSYADSVGRSRLTPDTSIRPTREIRGVLLSTGEDFMSDIESALGRTILIDVDDLTDTEIGAECWARRGDYRMLLPGILEFILNIPGDWMDMFKEAVAQETEKFKGHVMGISNGLRLASNLALNAWGFKLFLSYLLHIKVIDHERYAGMLAEYDEIVEDHLERHKERLLAQKPADLFFSVLGQKLDSGALRIRGLKPLDEKRQTGKVIGKVKGYTEKNEVIDGGLGDSKGDVALFPDVALEAVQSHYRAAGKKIPFQKDALAKALIKDGLIKRPNNSRTTSQVREDGRRVMAWIIPQEEFLKRCGLEDYIQKENKEKAEPEATAIKGDEGKKAEVPTAKGEKGKGKKTSSSAKRTKMHIKKAEPAPTDGKDGDEDIAAPAVTKDQCENKKSAGPEPIDQAGNPGQEVAENTGTEAPGSPEPESKNDAVPENKGGSESEAPGRSKPATTRGTEPEAKDAKTPETEKNEGHTENT